MAWKERADSNHHNFVGFIIHTVVRFFQFVLGLTVCGLYGQDLNAMRKAHEPVQGRWVYAEIVGALSALTALVFMVPFVKTYLVFGWDLLLFILWAAVFGIFGKLFIKEDAEGDSGIMRAKNAVWIDLANMLLWLITALYGATMFFARRSTRSTHTGRATV